MSFLIIIGFTLGGAVCGVIFTPNAEGGFALWGFLLGFAIASNFGDLLGDTKKLLAFLSKMNRKKRQKQWKDDLADIARSIQGKCRDNIIWDESLRATTKSSSHINQLDSMLNDLSSITEGLEALQNENNRNGGARQ